MISATSRYARTGWPGEPMRYASSALSRCSEFRSSCGNTATVRAPSSYAARNARTAISARFATRALENTATPCVDAGRLLRSCHAAPSRRPVGSARSVRWAPVSPATVGPVLVLGVCSLKGGVGKTSITLGLASAALERGLRTLVVDLDPQADSTMALGARPEHGDVADVLADANEHTIAAATVLSSWADDGLDVLVGSERSAVHDRLQTTDVDRLRYAL